MKSKPAHSVLKFTSLLMFGALLGKILGFVREMLFARQLGAGFVADSFRGATTAILIPISPLQGDMVPGALVPLHRQWSKENRAPQMFASLSLVLGIISIIIMIITYIVAEYYVDWLVGGFAENAKSTTVSFIHVMILSMPASVLFNCFSCVELGVGRIRLAVIRASLQNIAVIIGIIIMVFTGQPIAIAWGFSFAWIVCVVYGFIMLCLEHELAPLQVTLISCIESSTEFFRRARSLFTQPLFQQSSIILEKFLASLLSVGTIASMEYARTLTDTAMNFIGQPIGLAVLRRDSVTDIPARVKAISRPLLHVSIPASAFTYIFATDLVKVVFQRGAFQEDAINLTARAVEGISVGIWAAVLGWILVRILNAAHRNLEVAKVCMTGYVVNSLVSIATFKIMGVFGLGLGEASFGFALLAGTSYALGCIKIMLRLIAECLPITLTLSVASLLVCSVYDSSIIRLLIGSSVFGLVMIIYLVVLFPDLIAGIVTRFQPIVSRLCRKPRHIGVNE